MKILVTGGCGFIGSNLVDKLTFNGHEVTVLDDFSCVDFNNLVSPCFCLYGNAADEKTVSAAMEQQDAVIHLANSGGVGTPVDWQFKRDVCGGFNVLKHAQMKAVDHVILASSAGTVVGDVDNQDENLPPNPLSTYGASKAALEAYAKAFSNAYPLKVTILRFTNVFGPQSNHKRNLIPNAMRAAAYRLPLEVSGDGSQKRDFVYVEDVVLAICKALTYRPNEVLNISYGQSYSVMEMLKKIEDVTGHKFDIRYTKSDRTEIPNVSASFQRAIEALDYYPDWTLRQGLMKTWEWFYANTF